MKMTIDAADGNHVNAPYEAGADGSTKMRAPSTRTTRIGVPCAMNSPSVSTSTRRPSIEAMPAGRRKLTRGAGAAAQLRDDRRWRRIRALRCRERQPVRPGVLAARRARRAKRR